ncbi:hypothetical protein CR513_05954, partial [Mucuna pruriens]
MKPDVSLKVKEGIKEQFDMGFLTKYGKVKIDVIHTEKWGATYQMVMVDLFHDMVHKEIDIYLNDMITKSKIDKEHIINL